MRKTISITISITIASILFALFAQEPVQAASTSLPGSTKDPMAVMQAVFERKDVDRSRSRVRMTIRDKRGRSRQRVIRTEQLDFPGGTKSMRIFESPADVRNTGLLMIDYSDGAKEDAVWLYVRSLRRSTRISGGGKSEAFLGSDFSFSDMSKQDPSQFSLKLLDTNAKVDGEACWLVESRPRTARAKEETGYAKSHIWVSKEKLLPLQVKAWVKAGKKIKYIKATELRRVNSVWISHKMIARTYRNNVLQSETTLDILSIKSNLSEVKDANMTQQRLAKGL